MIRRLVETDFIEWEAKIWRVGRESEDRCSELGMRSRFRPWNWQCEKALASGFEVGWMFQPEELKDDEEMEINWRYAMERRQFAFLTR